jgi:predicted SAM-dependent methyltransferase
MELLLGCGHFRQKRVWSDDDTEWRQLVGIDFNRDIHPDVVADLAASCLPFKDNSFDEIHAYEVLEHMGQQGAWRFFFAQFDEFARVLKDQGRMFITSPHKDSVWLWGDPGHTRYIGPELVYFLDRANYDKNYERGTSMTDYRPYFKSNWTGEYFDRQGESNVMIIRNRKEF